MSARRWHRKHRRWPAILAACVVLAVVAGWFAVARDARLFIDARGDVIQYVETDDELQLPGPMLEFPNSDMPLVHQDMHALPWLFQWSVNHVVGDAPVAIVDWRGRLHATSPGIVDVWVRARGGTAHSTARFEVIPRLDTIGLRVSRDTIRVGDTLTVSYIAVQAGGAPLVWYGSTTPPWIEGDWQAVRLLPSRALGQFRYVAAQRGTAVFKVQLGKRVARSTVTVR